MGICMDATRYRYRRSCHIYYNSSLTLFTDGLDSMADALVSFIVWFGITMLHKLKNRLFHFGYAKIESFAAFVAAVVIVVLGAFIVYHAYERILHPPQILKPRNHNDYTGCGRKHISA
jgi:Co/Zn/Cd efflux system component